MQSAGAGPSTGIRRSARSTISTSSNTNINAGPSTLRARSALGGSTAATNTLKRKARSTSVNVEDEPLTTAKKPALSSAFAAHVASSSQQRQLLAAQKQVTELQNELLTRRADIDKLEADRRLLATRVDELEKGRDKAIEESSKIRESYSASLSSLTTRFTELEDAHEDLSEAHDVLQHTCERHKSTMADLRAEMLLVMRERDALAEERNRLKENAKGGRIWDKDASGMMKREETWEGSPSVGDYSEESVSPGPFLSAVRSPSFDEEDAVGEEDEWEGVEGEGEGERLERTQPRKGERADEDADGEAEEEDMSLTIAVPATIRSSQPPSSPPGTRELGPEERDELEEDDSIASSREISKSLSPTRTPKTRISNTQKVGKPGLNALASNRGASVASKRTPSAAGTPTKHIAARPSRPSSSTPLSGYQLTPTRSPQVDADRAIIRAELTKLTAHLHTLEASNARLSTEAGKLRQKAEGAEVLREQVRNMERRCEGVERLRARVAELEGLVEDARKRGQEAAAASENARAAGRMDVDLGMGGPSNALAPGTPMSVTIQLTSLRTAHALLLDKHGEMTSTLHARERELEESRVEYAKACSQTSSLQNDVGKLRDELRRKEKDVGLVQREVEFLKSLIASYKAEDTLNRDASAPDGLNVDAEKSKLEERILHMERLLEEYKSTIRDLEGEVHRLQNDVSVSPRSSRTEAQIEELIVRAKEVQEKNNELQTGLQEAEASSQAQAERVDQLEQELFELKGEIGGGRHIPPGVRVLCLRENPAQKWADARGEVLKRLKGENEVLLKRLEEVEAKVGTPPGAMDVDQGGTGLLAKSVPRESYESLKEEKLELEETVKQKEKRLLRLQQVFTAKSAEFREAIASILGLKLAFYPNGQVRVTSMYDLGASFVFQPLKADNGAGGGETKMQLIGQGEGGPQELEQLMNYWVQQEMSIPCFLASVTLECFDKVRQERERERAG